MSFFSVIIPTFNRADMVCRCIQSIFDTQWPDLEIIVVDDCSPDDTASKIKNTFGDKVKYIRNGKNSFQAVSRNNGAKSPKAICCSSLTTITSSIKKF